MKTENLIRSLYNCIYHCNACTDGCLDEEDIKKMVPCIRLNQICSTVCSGLATLLTIRSAEVDEMVRYCERMCVHCARECEKHDMEHCRQCARACRECEEACLEYLA